MQISDKLPDGFGIGGDHRHEGPDWSFAVSRRHRRQSRHDRQDDQDDLP
jgi:hypothetical protein